MKHSLTSNDNGPEFLDCKGLEERFGIRRSLAYELIQRNAIRSVSLRQRGALRGKRLFDVASVRAYLNSLGGVK
jgi:hypothetical protein